MARYRKIDTRLWCDRKFRALSAPPPCAQYLWMFLLTGPFTTNLPGLYRAGEMALAEELEWDLEGFRKSFRELFREGLAKPDWKARVVWVPNAIKYNPPENPNVVKGWRDSWDEIPECALKAEAYQRFKDFTEALGEGFAKAFLQACTQGLANQEQEQEQEPEQDIKQGPRPELNDSPPPKKSHKFVRPTLEEVGAYCLERGNNVDSQKWYDHYEANGWLVGKNPMKNWRAAIRTWERNGVYSTNGNRKPSITEIIEREQSFVRAQAN